MSRPTPLPARPLRPVATPALRGTICGALAALWFGPLPAGLSPVRLRVEWPLGYVTARIDLEE